MQANEFGKPILYKKIQIPTAFLTDAMVEDRLLQFGGDIRIGDLSGDGQADFLVYRSADGGMKPCFIGAFTNGSFTSIHLFHWTKRHSRCISLDRGSIM